jgi:2-oxoglutarate dehydrogenase E1 component
VFENIFETVNSGFAQALYEDYLRDPDSVPPAWRELFENGLKGQQPIHPDPTVEAGEPTTPAAVPSHPAAPPDASLELIKGPAFRLLQNMEASLDVPTATSYRDIDVSKLWAVRAALNRQLQARGQKLSFTHIIGWAVVLAAQEFPVMGHTVVEQDGDTYRLDPEAVNLGLAVDVEGKDGKRKLLVPVIRNADVMSFAEFYQDYERLVAGARDGKLLPDAYQGGTITLTNPGTLGTTASVPRLMKGQGSIIATGTIREVAGVRIMTISSTYDHRIIQGAESGMFLRRVDQLLQGSDRFYQALGAGVDIAGSAVEVAMAATLPPVPAAVRTPERGMVGESVLYHVAAAMALVDSYRTHGYLAAHLDPLGAEPLGDPALDPEPLGLTPDIMQQIPADVLRAYVEAATLADALPKLQDTYCGTIAYEIEHIANHVERLWLRRVIESGEHRIRLTADERRRLLTELSRVETLEVFLHKNYVGHKRFGIEGLDILVPMLHRALDLAAEQGASKAVMGMAHRGRLNVLAHVLGVPYEMLLAEFEGGLEVEETLTPRGGTGDVKYHHGATGVFEAADGHRIDVTLMPNPSHLEAVNPAVEGRCRAEQSDRSGTKLQHHPASVLPILIHGDAAFAAQGVVAETINLARLEGYGTGGTLHVIANNQIGFTTTPSEARSTDFASDLAKGFDVPIVHVNADDPEACLAAIQLAMMYREKFHGDVVMNLVGYRRHGHNEGDEPRYTQPLMYQRIDGHPTVRAIYAKALVEQGVLEEAEADAVVDRVHETLVQTQDRLRAGMDKADEGEEPVRISGLWVAVTEPGTAVDKDLLLRLNEELLTVPKGFVVNRKLRKLLDRHREALAEESTIDWPHAEALALAALLTEGVPLRLVGQDTVRGTFSQRHLTLFDADSGEPYTPMQHLADAKAPFELHNSPLSEFAALGFEYGYSVAAPEALVMWEAQFGDFANGAEVIIDQFIVAGLSKWGETSRLTLLLPHGYEGQGPEHSSARVERFLALAAEGNIRVANCSTPAQYFHLLRQQAKHQEMRPLVVMTPKSLLRLPQAVSRAAELASGRFEYVLDDTTLAAERDAVTRLVLCSGKVYYDVTTSERRAAATTVAVGRVEMLYPFPQTHVAGLVESYPKLEEIVWVQEEPRNFGARKFLMPLIAEAVPNHVTMRYVCRPERSSPAEGYPAAHRTEQARLVREALE